MLHWYDPFEATTGCGTLKKFNTLRTTNLRSYVFGWVWRVVEQIPTNVTPLDLVRSKSLKLNPNIITCSSFIRYLSVYLYGADLNEVSINID